jgi:serine protease
MSGSRAAFVAGIALLTACGLDAEDTRSAEAQLSSNDPLIGSQQWHLTEANISNAWNLTTGLVSTIVAVVDSGRMAHPDLDAKWVTGYDFFAGDADPADDGTYHHGIHTAGIIAAVTNNGVGVAGTCWGCRLMPLRALQAGGSTGVGAPGNVDEIQVLARAIRYAAGYLVDDGNFNMVQTLTPAAVVNISLGNFKTPCTQGLQTAIDDANAAGTVVVASAGNADDGDHDPVHYLWPTCQNVIVVTAAQETGAAEPYAITGTGITLAAPGGSAVNGSAGNGLLVGCTGTSDTGTSTGSHGVVSTWVTADNIACYRHWAGTSMSAPVVSGIVALMKSRNASVTAAQVKTILTTTARPACSGCGAGIVDAFAAVQAAPFSASASCAQTTPGHFACTSGLAGGLVPTVAWAAGAGSTITSQSTASAAGTCGGPTSVTFTATDGTGRQLTQTSSFACAVGHLVVTTPIKLGTIAVGGSASQQLVISNTGTAPVTLSSETLTTERGPSGLTFVGLSLPQVMMPGASLTQTVTCRPPIEANLIGSLSIVSDADNPSASSNLTCSGVSPHLATSPSSLALPDTVVGASSSATISVRNTSSSFGTVLQFRAQLPSGDFALTCDSGCSCDASGCVGSVGTTPAVLRITFTPGDASIETASLAFTANDPSRPQQHVEVTGNGIAGPVN